MTDVQCPAVILLITPDTIGAPEVRARRLAGVFIATGIPEEAPAFCEAQLLAAASSCRMELAELADGASLRAQANELADLYRGETIAVVAPSDAVCAAIHRTTPPTQPISVEIDNSGWNVLPPDSRVA